MGLMLAKWKQNPMDQNSVFRCALFCLKEEWLQSKILAVLLLESGGDWCHWSVLECARETLVTRCGGAFAFCSSEKGPNKALRSSPCRDCHITSPCVAPALIEKPCLLPYGRSWTARAPPREEHHSLTCGLPLVLARLHLLVGHAQQKRGARAVPAWASIQRMTLGL